MTTSETAAIQHSEWTPPTARERLAVIQSTKSVALYGASANPARPSYFVATYLVSSSTDFDVYFVNPSADEILGHKVYPSLEDLPVAVDLVDVFRRHEDLPGVADEVIAHGAKTMWIQLGLFNAEAAQKAHNAGLHVVMNRCLKIEHARFHGGLHLSGFDTGVINSKRRGAFARA